MLHPPDLNLASSYIPACLCILKSTAAFVLFMVSPVRGWIGLWCLLTVDRILLNQSNSAILDVNAVIGALVGGLMVMHTRADNPSNMAAVAVVALWIAVSASQIVGLSRFGRSYEIVLGACCVTLLSCLHQAPERPELTALRACTFVLSNIILPYLGVVLQHSDIDTYVNACRTMLFLLGEPEEASAWFAIYLLCVGYQFRSVVPKRTYNTPDPVVVVVNKTPALPEADEQSLLREALATRRGFRES
jgi:hypothetical protein